MVEVVQSLPFIVVCTTLVMENKLILLCMGVFLWCRYDVKDFGESAGNNLCTIVALFSLYQQAFMYWVLVTLSVEVRICVCDFAVWWCAELEQNMWGVALVCKALKQPPLLHVLQWTA